MRIQRELPWLANPILELDFEILAGGGRLESPPYTPNSAFS